MGLADEDTRKAIEAEEDGLHAALMSGDVAWIEDHWAPDAIYVHLSGGIEDRPAFIEHLRAGTTTYFGRETGDVQVRRYGDAAIVTGWSSLDFESRGQRRVLDTRFTRAYVSDGRRWRLVSSQSGATNGNPIQRAQARPRSIGAMGSSGPADGGGT
jgi:ketosteroid isomerase-like protein